MGANLKVRNNYEYGTGMKDDESGLSLDDPLSKLNYLSMMMC